MKKEQYNKILALRNAFANGVEQLDEILKSIAPAGSENPRQRRNLKQERMQKFKIPKGWTRG